MRCNSNCFWTAKDDAIQPQQAPCVFWAETYSSDETAICHGNIYGKELPAYVKDGEFWSAEPLSASRLCSRNTLIDLTLRKTQVYYYTTWCEFRFISCVKKVWTSGIFQCSTLWHFVHSELCFKSSQVLYSDPSCACDANVNCCASPSVPFQTVHSFCIPSSSNLNLPHVGP